MLGGMAHDETLAARIRQVLAPRTGIAERRMFGGVGWMVGGHMGCAVMGDDLVVRLAPEDVPAALEDPHAGPFGRAGSRPMKGFVVVASDGVAEDAELARWVDAGVGFAASLKPK
jgi:TfoX/Sxy family transcriptional regulator of competence genes